MHPTSISGSPQPPRPKVTIVHRGRRRRRRDAWFQTRRTLRYVTRLLGRLLEITIAFWVTLYMIGVGALGIAMLVAVVYLLVSLLIHH